MISKISPLIALALCVNSGSALAFYSWSASSGDLPDAVTPGAGGVISRIEVGSPSFSLADGEMTISSSYSGAGYFRLNFGDIADSGGLFDDGFAIETSFIVDASAQFDSRRGAYALSIRTGEARYAMVAGVDFVRLIRDFETGSPIVSKDTNGSFHTYRIEVDGTGVGSNMSVFYDGNPLVSATLGALGAGESNDITISFGDSSTIAGGTVRYTDFSVTSLIPEPSAVPFLFGLGTLGMIGFRRRVRA